MASYLLDAESVCGVVARVVARLDRGWRRVLVRSISATSRIRQRVVSEHGMGFGTMSPGVLAGEYELAQAVDAYCRLEVFSDYGGIDGTTV